MITAEEALRFVLDAAQRLEPISVPIDGALGRVLAEDVRACDPLPPYPASIKVRQSEHGWSFFFFLLFPLPLSLRILSFYIPVLQNKARGSDEY